MFKNLKSFIEHPLLNGLEIDSFETTVIRSTIIREKPFLRQIYDQWYKTIIASLPRNIGGPVIELGSGGGFLKDYAPELITSEIQQIQGVDLVFDAMSLPIAKSILRAIIMVDVLHHVPDADSFFSDAGECLKSGGRIIMHEPWVTPWSRIVYGYLHHEPFLPDTPEWVFPIGGPLSSANSALPWIIFHRDRKRFEQKYPELKITKITPNTVFSYLASGGVSLRSLVPGKMFKFCQLIEKLMTPWIGSLAMFATITIEKR